MRTYTPRFARTKEIIILVGLALAAIGFGQFAPALRALAQGRSTYGTVISVVKTKPGFPDEVYSTTQAIPADENRAATFWYQVEFADANATLRSARLNLASRVYPIYRVSDPVRIVYRPERPEEIFAKYDLGTWTPGFLFLLFGLALAGSFLLLRRYANRPIELPEDTPHIRGFE
jgi:hypothetical protein